MPKLDILTACTLFFDNDTNPHHFSLGSVTIPEFVMETFEHKPGGGAMAINMGMELLQPLELKFNLVGFDKVAMGKFGPRSGRTQITLRGGIRNKFDNTLSPLILTTTGMVGRMAIGEFKRGDAQEVEYEMKEVFKFSMNIDGTETIKVDYESNDYFIDGINQFAAMNAILGII